MSQKPVAEENQLANLLRAESYTALTAGKNSIIIRGYFIPYTTIDEVRWRCDPKALNLSSTNEIDARKNVIGQDRAIKVSEFRSTEFLLRSIERNMQAIQLGLEIDSPGYSIFIIVLQFNLNTDVGSL